MHGEPTEPSRKNQVRGTITKRDKSDMPVLVRSRPGHTGGMDAVNKWAVALRASDKSERTVRAYTGAVRACARHAGKPPSELTSDDVAAWLGRTDLSRNTKAAYYRRIGAWQLWYRESGRGKLRLLRGIQGAKGQPTLPRPVSETDLAALLGACRTDQERMMVLLGAWMGLRCAEICVVDGADFFLAPDGTPMLGVVGKGRKAADLPVPPVVMELAPRMPAGGLWFPGRGGGRPLTTHGMGYRMTVLAERAGCPGVTLHQLRHRFATRLVADGQHLFVVQELMRHSNPATTKGYVRVDAARLADAVGRLPRAA